MRGQTERSRERWRQIERDRGRDRALSSIDIYWACAPACSSLYTRLCSLCLSLWLSPSLSPLSIPLCSSFSLRLSAAATCACAAPPKLKLANNSSRLNLSCFEFEFTFIFRFKFHLISNLCCLPSSPFPLHLPGKRDLLSLLWHKPGRLGAYVLRMLDGPKGFGAEFGQSASIISS